MPLAMRGILSQFPDPEYNGMAPKIVINPVLSPKLSIVNLLRHNA
jgi:hypothetical protein